MTELTGNNGKYLNETQLYGLLDQSGVEIQEFDDLPREVKTRVEDGFFRLWRMNELGNNIIKEDQRISGPTSRLSEITEDRQRSKRYLVGEDWVEDSVRNLVHLAKMGQEPEDERRKLADKITDRTYGYLEFLRRGGADINDFIVRNLLGDELHEMNRYLVRRQENVQDVIEESGTLDDEIYRLVKG